MTMLLSVAGLTFAVGSFITCNMDYAIFSIIFSIYACAFSYYS